MRDFAPALAVALKGAFMTEKVCRRVSSSKPEQSTGLWLNPSGAPLAPGLSIAPVVGFSPRPLDQGTVKRWLRNQARIENRRNR